MEADSSYQLASVLMDFVFARDGTERKILLQACPELLSAEADYWLEEYAYQAQEAGDWQAERAYAEHRQLLAECRQWGVEALQGFHSYTELEYQLAHFAAGLRDMNERRAFLRLHSELLSEKARLVMEESIASLIASGQRDLLRRFRLCRDLLSRCRCRTPQEAFAAYRPPHPEILQAVNAVIAAGGARRLIQAALANARLLTRPGIANAFNYLYPYYEDDPFRIGQLDHLLRFLNGMYALNLKSPLDIIAEFNLRGIAAGLERLVAAGGDNNYLRLAAGWDEDLCIQISARRSDPLLFLEAPASPMLFPSAELDPEQVETLLRLGWRPAPESPGDNIYLLWKLTGQDSRLALARRVMRTFQEAYLVHPRQEYRFEIHLA